MDVSAARVPRKALGVSGILVGVSFILIGVSNCLLVVEDIHSLASNVLTFLVSTIFAFIGLALLPLSAKFALNRNASVKWVIAGFIVYACVLTILSFTKSWQLDSDTILNAEVTIMVALAGASTAFRGRLQGLLAGLPLLYMAVLLTLVEGFSTDGILSFGTGLSPPSLGLLFSWRPFEIAALFLASLTSLARALKRRTSTLAFLSLLSYCLGVLVPLFLPSTGALATLPAVMANFSIVTSPKLLGIALLAGGNTLGVITAVAGLALNRRKSFPTVVSQSSQTVAPRAARSYSRS